ncbi:hypothetical protein GCM10009727_95620 [Actinomadura napierensis]|uniref:Uncharacterized protein n=1 Tax=Actinomadura napierensis TaxID=267854 RepID=A0ABP5M9A0_9ACTN
MQALHAGGQDAFLVVDGDDHLDQPSPPAVLVHGRGRRGGRAPFGDKVTHVTEVRRPVWEAPEPWINAV